MTDQTWTHVVTGKTRGLLIECPRCRDRHGLINPPTGLVTIIIDCTPEDCVLFVYGVADAAMATNLTRTKDKEPERKSI